MILRIEQKRLHASHVLIADVFPGEAIVLVRPETLHQRKRIVFVKPERVSHVFAIETTAHFSKRAFKGVVQDVSAEVFRVIVVPALNLLANHVYDIHAPLWRQSQNDDLWMTEGMK